MIAHHITDLIGHTPLLEIPEAVHALPNVTLYAKMELLNPFGSVKDRVAWAFLKDQLPELIAENKLIVENSSGNTAKALQAISASFGLKFRLMTTLAKVPETKDVLRVMGAEIEELTQASTDCFDPNDPNDPQYVIEKLVQQSDGQIYFPSQFTNEKNAQIHRDTTGAEILEDLQKIDWFIGGLGTTGSTRGIIEALRTEHPTLKTLGVCAADYDYIPGIRSAEQMWETGLFNKSLYHHILNIRAKDAVDAMVVLNQKCGLLCGPSAGAQFAALQQYFTENPAQEKTNIVFLACDRMEWYLSYIKKYRPDLWQQTPKADQTPSYATFYPSMDQGKRTQISAEHVIEWIDQESPLLIDMRTPTSLKIIKFSGSINLPEQTLEQLIEQTQPFPEQKKILFICAVGHKSQKVAAFLREKNIQAYSLEGGITAYQHHLRTAKAA